MMTSEALTAVHRGVVAMLRRRRTTCQGTFDEAAAEVTGLICQAEANHPAADRPAVVPPPAAGVDPAYVDALEVAVDQLLAVLQDDSPLTTRVEQAEYRARLDAAVADLAECRQDLAAETAA